MLQLCNTCCSSEYLLLCYISCLQEVMEGFHNIVEKVFPGDTEAQAKVMTQLQQFRSMQGLFGRPAALLSRKGLAPHAWWNIYGACTPELQKLAIQVLSHVPTSDCIELCTCYTCLGQYADVIAGDNSCLRDEQSAGHVSLCM